MFFTYVILLVIYSTLQLHIVTPTSVIRSINVQGPIFAETVWESNNGPYVITGDFQVPKNVALIIKPGTQVQFNGDFQILVKGRVDIQGTRTKPVEFIGGQGQKPMLMFKSADLSQSTISHVQFTGPQPSIQLATESEHSQDSVKNFAILELNNIVLMNSKIQTNGYETKASLKIINSKINKSVIVGVYPRSEPIMFMNSVIDSSMIHSDSYNYGIQINDTTVRDSEMKIGCCSANIAVLNSRLTNITVRQGSGSPINGPFTFENSNVNGLNMNLPLASTLFKSSRLRIHNGQTIKVGVTNIRCSTFIGNSTDNGIEITGYRGYYPSNDLQEIVQSTFLNFGTAITIGADTIALKLDRNNFIGSTQYSVYTQTSKDIIATNNYWGVNRFDLARSTIYDYYRNIDYGQVVIDPIAPARISNDDCST